MNKELASLDDWFKANKLTVNLAKTKYIIFGSRQKLKSVGVNSVPDLLYLKNKQSIGRTSSTKFLGLLLDEHLAWDSHITYISRKIAKSIGILYKCRQYLNLDLLKKLYYSFIYSHLSYGAFIWGSNYKTKVLPLHILQKRALRIISFSHPRTSSRPLFQNLGILNIFEIVKFQLCEIAYKHVNQQLPDIFQYFFKEVQFSHNYNIRSASNRHLSLPRVNLNYGKFGVKYASAVSWNDVPIGIKASTSHQMFKTSYRNFLLSQ